jgi:curved DNA-binding protein CbpA
MQDDPYKILGVGRTAKPETIERAFRKLAMRFHPDRGGDRAKYERMMNAYEVLSDPIRRARYDETGDASTAPDNSEVDAAQEVAACLGHVLNVLRQTNRNPTKLDLVAEMGKAMGQKLSEHVTERMKHEREIEADKALLGRFTVDGGQENFLESSIRQQLNSRRANLGKVNGAIDRIHAAQAYLKRCKYRSDVLEATGKAKDSPTMSGLNEQWSEELKKALLNGTAFTFNFNG